MSCTLDESGRLLTLTEEGVTYPADYSFDNVNDFVHATETNYEDLECLCLGMATHIDVLTKLLLEARHRFKKYDMEVDDATLAPEEHWRFMKKIDEVLNGPYE